MAKGLDCGTGNYVACLSDKVKTQRNAFITIDQSMNTKKSLKRLNIPYVEINNKLHVIGKAAFEYAQVFGNVALRRPMADGLLNPKERDALPVLRSIIYELLGEPETPGERVIYCVPGTPIDKDTMVDYHESVLQSLIDGLGYSSRAINEAEALAYTGLVDNNLTGIAISFGAGMCNVGIFYGGMTAKAFSVSRGGDFIDHHVALDTGISQARAQFIKEESSTDIGNSKLVVEEGIASLSEKDLTVEQRAIQTYYGVLVRYLLSNIGNQFEAAEDIPAFKDPVPIVVGGGTAMTKGFLDVFNKELESSDFPINISEVRLVEDPFNAVARGCFADALLEEEE